MYRPLAYPIFWLLIPASFLIAGCDTSANNPKIPQYSDHPENISEKIYTLGIHPLHNPKKLYKNFSPLADYLSRHLDGIRIEIEASKDYASYNRKLAKAKFELALPNPYQTIKGFGYGYRAIAQMGANDNFKGIILVRKDSGINRISQLKGKKISYPAPTALAATMLPQYFLQTHGLDIKKDTQTLYVGSQESSIMNVYLKLSSASATWPIPWYDLNKNQPQIANQLKIAWSTQSLPNNSFCYNTKKVPAAIAQKIQTLLVNLNHTAEGKKILNSMNIKQIQAVDNENYDPILKFMREFNTIVGDNSKLAK